MNKRMDEFTDLNSSGNDKFAEQHSVSECETLTVNNAENLNAGFKAPKKFLRLSKTLAMKMKRKSRARYDKLKVKSSLTKRECDVSISDFSESTDSQYTHSVSSSSIMKECDMSLDSLQFSLCSSFEEPNLLPLMPDDNNVDDDDGIFNIKLSEPRLTNDVTPADGFLIDILPEGEYPIKDLKEVNVAINCSNYSNVLHSSMSCSTDDEKELGRSNMIFSAECCYRLPENAMKTSKIRLEECMVTEPSSSTEMFGSSLSYSTEESQSSEEMEAAYSAKRCHLLPEIFFENDLNDEDILLSPADSTGTNLSGSMNACGPNHEHVLLPPVDSTGANLSSYVKNCGLKDEDFLLSPVDATATNLPDYIETCKKEERIIESDPAWNSSQVVTNTCDGTEAATIFSEMQYSSVLDPPIGSNILGSVAASPSDSDLPLIIECLTSNTDSTEGADDFEEDEMDSPVHKFRNRKRGDETATVGRCDVSKALDVTFTNSSTGDRMGIKKTFPENRSFKVLLLLALLLTALFHPKLSNIIVRSIVKSNAHPTTKQIDIVRNSSNVCGKTSSINLDGKLSQVKHPWESWNHESDETTMRHTGLGGGYSSNQILKDIESREARTNKNLAPVRFAALSYEEIIKMAVDSMLQ